ncbi:hypothetical protein [Streptacidiphilus fuscans]|uniref:Uncharacterized protein n=1 Tax=Streptacidiphilus fuscans TaxID=2789292 RepID=A0A931B7X2_9ACTN|nr:hypothetical protein [Streptacidiphilus fuscans]MBF9071771.1 hypothetical protein [Streptacidiphilus fuscans]
MSSTVMPDPRMTPGPHPDHLRPWEQADTGPDTLPAHMAEARAQSEALHRAVADGTWIVDWHYVTHEHGYLLAGVTNPTSGVSLHIVHEDTSASVQKVFPSRVRAMAAAPRYIEGFEPMADAPERYREHAARATARRARPGDDHTVTVGYREDLDVLVAFPPDRLAAFWLFHAGFVRDNALDLYRPRRGTSPQTAERQLRDACRYLAVSGYSVTRVYSDIEQQVLADQQPVPAWYLPSPPRTAGDPSPLAADVAADLSNQHLVMLAHHESPEGDFDFLGRYRADNQAAIFSTAPGGRYTVSLHPDLDAAEAAWTALGRAAKLPAAGPRAARGHGSRAAPAIPPSAQPRLSSGRRRGIR